MYHGEGDRTQYRTNYIIHFLNMEKVLETRGIKIKAADGAYAEISGGERIKSGSAHVYFYFSVFSLHND